jgi:hypothetical protein
MSRTIHPPTQTELAAELKQAGFGLVNLSVRCTAQYGDLDIDPAHQATTWNQVTTWSMDLVLLEKSIVRTIPVISLCPRSLAGALFRSVYRPGSQIITGAVHYICKQPVIIQDITVSSDPNHLTKVSITVRALDHSHHTEATPLQNKRRK